MKLKEAFLLYFKRFCVDFSSRKEDKTLFSNVVLPLINLYRKYKQYFTVEMKEGLNFVLFALENRKNIDKKKENMLIYYQAMERMLK